MKRTIFILIFSIFSYLAFTSEAKTADETAFDNEKITLTIERYHDQMYPLDAKEFRFYQGETEITPEQFITLSQDEILLKNQKIIRNIKIGGFTGAAILGGLTLSFFIPSAIFVAVQLNYYNQQINYESMGYKSWLEYYNAKYPEYFIPGLTCIVLTVSSIFLLLIDLSVTFTLLYQHKFNERLYREAVERYNAKLMEKYNIMPEISFNSDNVNLGIKINL